MLLSTHNILKRKLGENLEQNTHKKSNHGPVPRSKSDQIQIAPTVNNQNKFYQNGLFNNPAENQKDFVIVKFSDGCNAKVSHASITIRSIVKDDDLFGEIKKGQSCKVMFHDKILAAVVMSKGSKETLTEQMDKFCETFEQDEVGKKCDDSNKNDITKGEQLSSLLKEIQEKESELNSLRLKYENLKKMEQSGKSNRMKNDLHVTNKTTTDNGSKKIVTPILKDSIGNKTQSDEVIEKNPLMDSEYPLIPASVKDHILKLGKDRSKKDSFLFRYCFINSFKGQDNFFAENSIQNLTPEYRQFIDMTLSLIKSIRPNVKPAMCHHMVSQLHCEAKRKLKLLNIRKSFTKSKEESLVKSKANSNKPQKGTISTNSNGLTDEEKLDMLEAKQSDKLDNPIDYILIDD